MSHPLSGFDDLQHMAEQVLEGDNFELDLKSFLDYTEQMRHWVLRHFDEPAIVRRARQLPVIDYDNKKGGLWSALPGGGGIGMYKQHKEKEVVKEKVKEMARLFDDIRRLLEPYYD
jgi:hypothetical protein